MSRPLRIQYHGAVYHVMNRGNARQDIFERTDHRQLFIRCLTEMVKWGLKSQAFVIAGVPVELERRLFGEVAVCIKQ